MDEEQRKQAMESLARTVKAAPSKRDLAWLELKNGVNPAWVATKYGFPVEKMVAAAEQLAKQRSERDKQNPGK
jgi:surface antigen